MLPRYAGIAAIAGFLLFSGCSDVPKAVESKVEVKKGPEIPAGPILALTAYYKMYEVARKWSPDIQPLGLSAIDAESLPGEDGKFPAWKAMFGSATKRQAVTYTYSTVEHAGVLKGVRSGSTVPWAGGGAEAQPYSNSDIKIDSDAAYKVALERADAWLKKNSDKPITEFALGDSSRFPAPVWYVIWGSPKNGFAAYVNATNGKVFGK